MIKISDSFFELATHENSAQSEVRIFEGRRLPKKTKADVIACLRNWLNQSDTRPFLESKRGRTRSPLFWAMTTAHRTMKSVIRMMNPEERRKAETVWYPRPVQKEQLRLQLDKQ